ncbi:n-acetylmuramoyl-l-alanine amidase [Lasius niger]|uniref:N-acetylmuramoyl-l-alanine amidase n=1 Tax=Lasius niger TaxID=67767 RepID=A0A0J7K5X3_LASNI|nr:n-acetylmuramoyl-l-alanine amidase [Lasius niger]
MLSSKDAKEKKTVEDALQKHYEAFNSMTTAFNSMTTAYIQVLALMHTMSSIKDMMHEEMGKACSNFLKSTSIRDRSTELNEMNRASYANTSSKNITDKVRVPRGPALKIPKTDTKDAVLKAIDPGKVGLKVSRLSKIRNNSIRIEACEVDLGKLKTSPGLRKAGLESACEAEWKEPRRASRWFTDIHFIQASSTQVMYWKSVQKRVRSLY